jgi:hypothetical protein
MEGGGRGYRSIRRQGSRQGLGRARETVGPPGDPGWSEAGVRRWVDECREMVGERQQAAAGEGPWLPARGRARRWLEVGTGSRGALRAHLTSESGGGGGGFGGGGGGGGGGGFGGGQKVYTIYDPSRDMEVRPSPPSFTDGRAPRARACVCVACRRRALRPVAASLGHPLIGFSRNTLPLPSSSPESGARPHARTHATNKQARTGARRARAHTHTHTHTHKRGYSGEPYEKRSGTLFNKPLYNRRPL